MNTIQSKLRTLHIRLDANSLRPRTRPQHRRHQRPAAAIADNWSDDARTAVTDALIRRFLASSSGSFQFPAAADTEKSKPRPPRTPRGNKGQRKHKKQGPPHNNQDDHHGLQAQVVAHLLKGQFDEHFLKTVPTTTLNWTIKTLGKQERLDLAEQLFHWMRIRQRANEHSFVKLCEACEANRLPARAVLAWRNTSRLPASFKLAERSAAALLKTFRPMGDLESARRILDEMIAKKLPLNQYAFNIVIRIAADLEDLDAALEVAQLLRRHETSAPDSRTYSSLFSALVSSGRWSRTSALHKAMIEENIIPDSILYLQLMSGYAGSGRPEAAEAVLDSMVDNGLKPGRAHWNALLSAYAQARRYEGCVVALERMIYGAEIRPDGYTMVALLHGGAGAKGGVTAASRVVGLMQKYDIPLTVEIGTALIACCRHAPVGPERRRSVEFAHGVMTMLKSAGLSPNIRTFNSLMAVLADAEVYGGVKDTLDALEKTKDIEPNEATWNIALRAFQKAGMYDKVLETEALRETWRTLHGRQPI